MSLSNILSASMGGLYSIYTKAITLLQGSNQIKIPGPAYTTTLTFPAFGQDTTITFGDPGSGSAVVSYDGSGPGNTFTNINLTDSSNQIICTNTKNSTLNIPINLQDTIYNVPSSTNASETLALHDTNEAFKSVQLTNTTNQITLGSGITNINTINSVPPLAHRTHSIQDMGGNYNFGFSSLSNPLFNSGKLTNLSNLGNLVGSFNFTPGNYNAYYQQIGNVTHVGISFNPAILTTGVGGQIKWQLGNLPNLPGVSNFVPISCVLFSGNTSQYVTGVIGQLQGSYPSAYLQIDMYISGSALSGSSQVISFMFTYANPS